MIGFVLLDVEVYLFDRRLTDGKGPDLLTFLAPR
jgi:hypothetical protein